MSDTGWKSPTTVTNETKADAEVSWTVTPSEAASQNDDYAETEGITKTEDSDYLRAVDFNLDIPNGATIDGIIVEFDRYTSVIDVYDSVVRLRVTAGQKGDNKAVTSDWTTSDDDIYDAYGNSTDKWGTTWSAAELNSADFGIDLSIYCNVGGTNYAYVDHIRIKVFYTALTFPTVVTTNKGTNGATTSHTINLPSGIEVGDLLLVFFATDGDNTITNWGGFTELDQQKDTKDVFGAVGFKVAVGSDTLTITTSVSEPSSYVTFRIAGWESDFNPEISIYVYGTTDVPNSSSVTPSWAQDNTLWISTCMNDSNSTITVYPWADNNDNQAGGAVGDCGVGVCSDNLNSISEDPSAFTLNDAEQWFAWTIAVAPDGASEPVEAAIKVPNSKLINRNVNRKINDKMN